MSRRPIFPVTRKSHGRRHGNALSLHHRNSHHASDHKKIARPDEIANKPPMRSIQAPA